MRQLLLCALLCACTAKKAAAPVATEAPGVVRQTLVHPDSPPKQVEFFWARPAADGRWPVIVYIHGHQEAPRPGGKVAADQGILEKMAKRGVVAVAVSQPGYGQSDGPPDFCGPYTQHAVLAVLAEVRGWPFVDPDKIALYGVSRGAIVASRVEAQDHRLAAAILVAGLYDLEASYQALRADESNFEARGIAANIAAESGATTEALRARSAVVTAKQIRTPTLILNGAKDFRVAVPDILRFEALVKEGGVYAKAVIFPDDGHFVPLEKRNLEIEPFLEKYLGLAPEAR